MGTHHRLEREGARDGVRPVQSWAPGLTIYWACGETSEEVQDQAPGEVGRLAEDTVKTLVLIPG